MEENKTNQNEIVEILEPATASQTSATAKKSVLSQLTDAKYIVTVAMMAAIAFVLSCIGNLIPIAWILKHDFKDIAIVIAGFIYGPFTSLLLSVVVPFLEFLTISTTGPWGLLMNIVSTSSFTCVAVLIYKYKRNIWGAVIGLGVAMLFSTGVMILWNYVVTPIYMAPSADEIEATRQAVVKMLIPTFLPFNLIKNNLNLALTLLIYKPLTKGLRKANLLPQQAQSVGGKKITKGVALGLLIGASFIVVTCVLFILALQGVI